MSQFCFVISCGVSKQLTNEKKKNHTGPNSEFADDNFIRAQIVRYVIYRIENLVGKGENAGSQHFLLSHNVFFPSENNGQFISYSYFVVSKCFQFGSAYKFVVVILMMERPRLPIFKPRSIITIH